jgi:cell division protein ZapB
MHQPDTTPTFPIDLGQLERQVETLLDICIQLREENVSLRQRQEALVAEKAELIEKTELARTRVEAMITRLKAMEHGL